MYWLPHVFFLFFLHTNTHHFCCRDWEGKCTYLVMERWRRRRCCVLCFGVQTLLLPSFCSSVFLVSYALHPSVFSSLCSPLPLLLFSFFLPSVVPVFLLSVPLPFSVSLFPILCFLTLFLCLSLFSFFSKDFPPSVSFSLCCPVLLPSRSFFFYVSPSPGPPLWLLLSSGFYSQRMQTFFGNRVMACVHHGSRETCSLDWSKSRLRRCKFFSASSRNVF